MVSKFKDVPLSDWREEAEWRQANKVKLREAQRIAVKKLVSMRDYRWSTEQPHSSNEETMSDYIGNHSEWEEAHQYGSYAELLLKDGTMIALHASGDGDFCNHRIRFEELTEATDEFGLLF